MKFEENVSGFQRRSHSKVWIDRRTTDGKWSQQLILSLCSDELKIQMFDWLCWGLTTCQPRERENRDRRDSRGDEREGQGRKRKINESEETEEIKISPSTLTCCKDRRPYPTVSQYQIQDTRHLCLTQSPTKIQMYSGAVVINTLRFKSYWDNGVIIKGPMQWNAIQLWAELCL